MSFKNFLKFVEIKTTLMSLIGFLLGAAFTLYYFWELNWQNSLIFFIGMIFFDFVTTGINNIMDYLKAKNLTYRDEINILGYAHISVKTAATYVITMLICASIAGLILVWQTNILLLFIGGFCFLVGIFYTFGPLPLSRMPLGELFSGVVQGLGIPFIFIYVNAPKNQVFSLLVSANWDYQIKGSLLVILAILVISYPQMCSVANVMLANNICDMEMDIKNKRTTFPIVVGKKRALQLFTFLAYSPYLAILVGVLCRFLPLTSLLTFLTLFAVVPNTRQIQAHQEKDVSFDYSVKNAVIMNITLVLTIFAGLLLPH